MNSRYSRCRSLGPWAKSVCDPARIATIKIHMNRMANTSVEFPAEPSMMHLGRRLQRNCLHTVGRASQPVQLVRVNRAGLGSPAYECIASQLRANLRGNETHRPPHRKRDSQVCVQVDPTGVTWPPDSSRSCHFSRRDLDWLSESSTFRLKENGHGSIPCLPLDRFLGLCRGEPHGIAQPLSLHPANLDQRAFRQPVENRESSDSYR